MESGELQKVWSSALSEAKRVLDGFLNSREQLEKCQRLSQMMTQTFKSGGRIFSCGNGGSHCDAMHLAEEFTGKYRKDRRPLPALALGDASHTTCVGNDYGFEYIFLRQLQAFAQPGDLLLGLSTSGNSLNLIKAFEFAKQAQISTVALLGRDGGKLKSLVDLAIVVPAETSDRIQEMHIKIIHTAIETVERDLFPANYSNTK